MSDMSHPHRPEGLSALPAGLAGQVMVGLGILAAMAAWLAWMDRPLTCPCGTVALWDGDPHSPGASQQFADWYSALHVMYGIGLYAFIRRMAPRWPLSWMFLAALASSAIWEAMENTPAMIALFGDAPGTPSYEGDSILNAFGDTLFVVLGFFAARGLPVPATLFLALALEGAVAFTIGDGFILGSLRLLGVGV
ncbi:DUF2585 family protein [Aureimonas sp. AU20]|uniref:DUF2585 family protein n=1 Tax=Aureimonas sp. AU20 TaxID=1349819 RepID=UPI0007824480|nr:DUF2585 family protein [Aureimonas sp. AU20]